MTNAYPYDEYDRCGVWVDWNQDKLFDDAETISISPSQTTPGGGVITFTGTITPPAGAALGSTRMRVRVMWGASAMSPCDATSYGEVEDYTVKVVPSSWLPGDFVGPYGVDMRDFGIVAGQWQKAPGEPSADIAPGCGDGVVDWFDLGVLVDNWLAGVSP
ncbi:MAG: GEVED domain-containing protein [Planctomycetota bacterium]